MGVGAAVLAAVYELTKWGHYASCERPLYGSFHQLGPILDTFGFRPGAVDGGPEIVRPLGLASVGAFHAQAPGATQGAMPGGQGRPQCSPSVLRRRPYIQLLERGLPQDASVGHRV